MTKINPFKWLQFCFILMLLLFLAVGSYVYVVMPQSGFISVLGEDELPIGKWNWTWQRPFYAFDQKLSTLEIIQKQEAHDLILRFESSNEKPDVFNGLGIEGDFVVPSNGHLQFEWRTFGKGPDMRLHVSDASPKKEHTGVGENFFHMLPIPGEDWTHVDIALSKFVRNSWQPDNAPTDGVLQTGGIDSIEFGLDPDVSLRFEVRGLKFGWSTGKNEILALYGMFFLLGLFLLYRTTSRLFEDGQVAELLAIAVVNRISYLVVSVGLLLQGIIQADALGTSLTLLYCLFAFCLFVDVLLPVAAHQSKMLALRYFFFFTLIWFVSTPINIVSFGFLYFVVLLYIARQKSVLFFLTYPVLSCLIIFIHPQLPADLITEYFALVVFDTLTVYLLLEYVLNRKLRKDMSRLALLYEGIFTHSADAIYTISVEGDIIDANRGFCTLTGKKRKEIIGQNIKTFIDPSDHDIVSRRVETDQVRRYDAKFLMLKDDIQYAYVTEHPIVSSGELIGFQIISTDITERLELEKELREANEMLEQLAMKDALTAIYNRRYFDTMYQREWRRAIRKGTKLTLLLGDIDYFKLYNDTYGHQQGDSCLVQVASTLESTVKRVEDVVARYGGEEFVVMLPDSNEEMVQTVAEQLVSAIRELGVPHESSTVSDVVTISLGVATLNPARDESPDSLFVQADKALYEAKEKGRDQFCIS